MTNNQDKGIEEMVEEFYKEFSHIYAVKNEMSGNSYKTIADWLRNALTQAKEQGYQDGYKQGQFDAEMDALLPATNPQEHE